MGEDKQQQKFDLAAVFFYVVGGLSLMAALGTGLGFVIMWAAEPKKPMPWELAAVAAGTLAAGIVFSALGVLVTKRWKYTGVLVAVVLFPFLFVEFPRGAAFALTLYGALWADRKTFFPLWVK